jgi:hypothetical protein
MQLLGLLLIVSPTGAGTGVALTALGNCHDGHRTGRAANVETSDCKSRPDGVSSGHLAWFPRKVDAACCSVAKVDAASCRISGTRQDAASTWNAAGSRVYFFGAHSQTNNNEKRIRASSAGSPSAKGGL